MALSSNVHWEVRTTGNSNYGGGYNVAASGTDYSQQGYAQVGFNGSTIALSMAGTGTTLNSSPGAFSSSHVGNMIYITGGTNFTVGFYEITGYTSASAVTIDRNATNGSAASSGSGNLGGAQSDLQKVADATVAGNKVWVKAGTYQPTATLTLPYTNSDDIIEWEGYNTSRGDADSPCVIVDQQNNTRNGITLGSSSASNRVSTIMKYFEVRNVYTSSSTYHGFYLYGRKILLYKCSAKTCGGRGFYSVGFQCSFVGCEANDVGKGSLGSRGFDMYYYGHCVDCIVRDSECYAYFGSFSTRWIGCIADNCRYGWYLVNAGDSHGLFLSDCLANNSTYDGFYWYSTHSAPAQLINCIAVNNGRWGFNATSTIGGYQLLVHCASGNNTSGDRVTSSAIEYEGDFSSIIDLGSSDIFVDYANDDLTLRPHAVKLLGKAFPNQALFDNALSFWINKDIGPLQFPERTRIIG